MEVEKLTISHEDGGECGREVDPRSLGPHGPRTHQCRNENEDVRHDRRHARADYP